MCSMSNLLFKAVLTRLPGVGERGVGVEECSTTELGLEPMTIQEIKEQPLFYTLPLGQPGPKG